MACAMVPPQQSRSWSETLDHCRRRRVRHALLTVLWPRFAGPGRGPSRPSQRPPAPLLGLQMERMRLPQLIEV